MTYKIVEVFEKGMKRYYVNQYGSDFSSGPISEDGPYTMKKSAQICLRIKKMNARIMKLVQTHKGLDDEDHEVIFEVLEGAVDRCSE